MADIPKLDEAFWSERYKTEQVGWNIGYPSTPLKTYIDQLEDKSINILIPGAGNAYEAEYLHKSGFDNVFVLDIALPALDNIQKRYPGFPKDHLLHQDFFEHHGQYDLILEQTFFCAIPPGMRQRYADKMQDLLVDGGKLVGLWFCFPPDPEKITPPFTGTVEEYQTYFENFESAVFTKAYNSIPPRKGRELFGQIKK